MKTSESIIKIAPAIVKAQGAIQTVAKDAENTFFKKQDGSGAKYATLDAIIEAIKKPLLDNELSVIQMPTNDESGKPCVITRIQHASGEYFENTTPLMFSKVDMQGFGSAVTYAKRYALGSFFNIATEVDDDANSISNKEKLSDYVIRNGKLKGKTLKDISLDVIANYLKSSDEFFNKKGEPPYGTFKDDINNARTYLAEMEKQ